MATMNQFILKRIRFETNSNEVVLSGETIEGFDFFESNVIVNSSAFNKILWELENQGIDLDASDVIQSQFSIEEETVFIVDFKKKQDVILDLSAYSNSFRLLRA